MQQYVIVNSKRSIINQLLDVTYDKSAVVDHIIWDSRNNNYIENHSSLCHNVWESLYNTFSYYPVTAIYELFKNNNTYDSMFDVPYDEFNAEETCKVLNLPFMTFGYIHNPGNDYNSTYMQPMYYIAYNISNFIRIETYETSSNFYGLATSEILSNGNANSILNVMNVTEYPDCTIQKALDGDLLLEYNYYYDFLGINETNTSDNRIINILSLFKKLLYKINVYSDMSQNSYETTLYGIPYIENNGNNLQLKIIIHPSFNNDIYIDIVNKYVRIETPEFINFYLGMTTSNLTQPTLIEYAPGAHNIYFSENGTTLRIYIDKEESILSKELNTTVNYISILPVINMFARGTYVNPTTATYPRIDYGALPRKHRYMLFDNNRIIVNVSIDNYPYIDVSIPNENGTVKNTSYSNTLFKIENYEFILRGDISNLYSSDSSATRTPIFIPHVSHIEIVSQEDSRLPQNEESSFYHLAEPYATILQPETMEIITYDDFRYNSNNIEYAKITTYIRDKYLQVYHPSWDTSWALHKQSYTLGAVEGISNISNHEIENYPLRYSYSLLEDFLSSSVTSVSERLPDTDTIFLESHKFYCLQNIYNQNDPVQLHEINSWFTLNRKMEIDFRRSIRSKYDSEDKQYVISVSRYDFFYRPLKLSNIDNMVSIQEEWQEKDFAYGIYYTNDDMNEISLDITIPSSRVLDLTTYLNTDVSNVPLTDYKYVFFSKDFVTYQAPYFMAMLTSDSELSISDSITKEKMLELGITSTTSSNYNNQRIDTGLGYIRFRKAPSYTESLPDTVINIMSHTNYRTIDMNTAKDGFTGRTHLIENESIAKGRRYFIGVWYTLYPWRGYLSYNPLPNTKLLTFITATKDTSSNITISAGSDIFFDLGKQNTLNVESSTTSTRIVIYLLDKYNEPETYTKLYEITTNNASVDLIDYIEQIYKDYNQQYTIDDTVQIPLLIDVIGNLGTEYVYNSVKLIVTFTLEGNLIYSKNILVEGDDSNRRIYENKLYEMQAKTTTYPTEGSVTYNVVSENPIKAIAIEANTEEISGTIDFYIVIDNKKYKIVPLNTSGGLPNILFVSPPEEIESYLKANYGDSCIIKIDKLLYTFDIEVDFKTNNQYYTPELSLLKVLVSGDLTSFMGG